MSCWYVMCTQREERSGSRGRRTPNRVMSDYEDDDDDDIVVTKGKPRTSANKFF